MVGNKVTIDKNDVLRHSILIASAIGSAGCKCMVFTVAFGFSISFSGEIDGKSIDVCVYAENVDQAIEKYNSIPVDVLTPKICKDGE